VCYRFDEWKTAFRAMKIARTPTVSERLIEWYAPLPAPSLRELSSECETEGVYCDEWRTPFVGAMKIARTLPVSEWLVEWYKPPYPSPAPSLRELSSEARLRECTAMNVKAQKFQSQNGLVCKLLASINHRTTLPQSRPLGVTAPSEREPGWLSPFIGVLAKIRGYGRFSSPLRNSDDFGFCHSTDDTPSVTPVGRDSSLREGAGERSHSTGCSLKSYVGGRFSSPLRRL